MALRRAAAFSFVGMSVLANIHRQSTVAAATVFAGKPAPTLGVGTQRRWEEGRCRSGFTREWAGTRNPIARPWRISLLPTAQPLL
ncbi:MAG TPA: hypothetical protein DDZ74_22975 [Pseudomonas sp.]|nr:hypothetical protein [Pseudomonas sp.]